MMKVNLETEEFIAALLKDDYKEMRRLQNKVAEVVDNTLRKFRSTHGDRLSHTDPEAISLDMQQEVLTDIIRQCHNVESHKYLENLTMDIHYLARKHVKKLIDKVMAHRGATLTEGEKEDIRGSQWSNPEVGNKRKIYRIEEAFVSLEEYLENKGELESSHDFIHEEAYDLLSKAMSNLSDAHKDIVSFYYFEGLTQSEVGERMGVTERTVRSKLKESVDHIKKFVGHSVDTPIEV